MPDKGKPAAPEWGDEFRRTLAGRRRRRRLVIAVLAGCTAGPLAASALWAPATLLVWNASASAPEGLYRLRSGEHVRRGDMVVAWTPEPARSLAAGRRYLPANVPLVKRAAAVAGDRVCASGSTVSINGRRAAIRRASDSAGRPMPWWSGCRRLLDGEYLLLMEHSSSFDGRYFGLSRSDHLIGRAELLWAR